MKQSASIFILLFIATKLFGQTLTNEQIEEDLHASYKRILFYRFEADTINWEFIQKENEVFREKLLHYTSKYPSTLNFTFKKLSYNIYINSSEDSLVKIYSWDTWLGGTMHDFENVYQFKSSDKVYSQADHYADEKEQAFYSQIHSVKTTNKTYYLTVNNAIYSTKDAGQSIKVFVIESNSLNNTTELIKTTKGMVNSIDVSYDFFSVVDRPERPLRLIRYDSEKKLIYIPIVYENGKVTDRYIIYRFTGQYFEHAKTQRK